MGALPGIDVSHHQGLIDWAQVAGSGQRFAIGKATNGRTFVDPNFAYNKAGAEASGLAFGAYHFARPDDSANDAIIEAGRAEIYLDGPLVRTVDNYAPSRHSAWRGRSPVWPMASTRFGSWFSARRDPRRTGRSSRSTGSRPSRDRTDERSRTQPGVEWSCRGSRR